VGANLNVSSQFCEVELSLKITFIGWYYNLS